MPLKYYLKKIHNQYTLLYTRRRWTNEEKKYLSHISFPELTKDEIAKIKHEWKGIPVTEKYFNEYRFYKKLHGFDACYLAMPIYDPLIIRKLNPFQDACVFINKGLFDIFFTELKQPKLYIKKIDHHYFDGQSKLISPPEAIDILCQHDQFIIKPSTNSHGGTGIKLIRHKMIQSAVKTLIDGYKDDFVVQEIIVQHPDTAKFNPESLNTIRVISLFLNGKVTILKSALRCGQNGAEVDNATSGGLMIKIKEDGFLESFGVDARFEKIFKTDNGIQIAGNRVTDFYKLKEIVKIYHSRLYPTLHLIAWDFAINREGEPIFIEGNTKVPGIFWMQMCAGPIFGDLTKEIIEYVLKNKNTI